MRAMKDSGIPWIGMIPSEWNMVNFRYSGNFTKGKLPTSTNIDGVGSPVIGASEMLGGEYRQFSTCTDIPTCTKDDILILWDGANAGITATNLSGIVSSTAVKYSCYDSKVSKPYLAHLFKYAEHYFKERVGGTTIPHMNIKYIDSFPLLVPPLSEQERIADFLDTKCAEIDEMIALQEKTVEELKAYKQSIITEAVTKGLNPDAPMKDSGIPWIGLIPQGWNTIRLKQLCNIKTGSQDTINRVDDGQYPFFVRSPKVERINSYCYDGEAILMAGDGVGAGRVFHHYIGKFDCHQRVYYLHEFRGINTRYLYHFLSYNLYKLIDAGSAKSTVDSVRLPMQTNFVITIPSKKEQREIVSYIDKKGQEIDSLIEIKQQKAEELKTYKKSLIYEYVTGKKEVI